MEMFDLRGKRAFIPGGYGGIGAAIAEALCEAGASVVVAGRSEGKAQALAGSLSAKGHAAHGIAMDGESVESIAAGVDRAASLMGGLDILVNCVGKNREQRLAEATPEVFDEI